MTSSTRKAELCGKHRGKSMPDLAPGIKEMLDNLPENQSGPGRHKCATCAYNEGFEAGYNEGFEAGKKHALKKAMELLKTL